MPQLIPFYYTHLITIEIIFISLLLYIVSSYILPNILRLLLSRLIIVKLVN